MFGAGSPTLTMNATGVIAPSSFLMIDRTARRGVKVATANALTLGVSEKGTRVAPGLDTALYQTSVPNANACAIAGEQVEVYKPGDLAVLTAGAGGFAYGDDLGSDANGNAITVTTAGNNVGALALDTVPAGSVGLVLVVSRVH